MIKKNIDTSTAIHELIASRWSGRAYDPEMAVSRDQLTSILEAARWAPSCFGDEPWRYLVWDKLIDPAAWQRAFECLSEGNREWVVNAPVLLLATADSIFAKNGKPNRWGQHDTGAASENICLQAAALGLMAHQMGGFDADRIRAEFHIPDQYTPMAMITIGHQMDLKGIKPEWKERELAKRERQPLGERFFMEAWGNPYLPGE